MAKRKILAEKFDAVDKRKIHGKGRSHPHRSVHQQGPLLPRIELAP